MTLGEIGKMIESAIKDNEGKTDKRRKDYCENRRRYLF